MNRRSFFAAIAAFLGALFSRKATTTLSAAPSDPPPTLDVHGWAEPIGQAFLYTDDGYVFYLWPEQPLGIQFHHHAFTLDSEPVDPGPVAMMIRNARSQLPQPTPEMTDQALQDLNAMMDRWHAEDWNRKVQDGRIRL